MLFHILFIFTNSIIEPTEFEVEENSTSNDTNAYSSDGEYCLPPVEVYIDNNPTKAEKVLGWKAEKSLEDMCKDSWRFTQNNM